ncbi:MAG: hypothetical protein EBY18_23005, partial [Alphaproteobacteria bacterium]|nr:hypothetical protein [Alphaproteobacteria bacterium]
MTAVNGQLAKLGTVNGYRVRNLRGVDVTRYDLRVEDSVEAASAGDEVRMEAFGFALTRKVTLNGVKLVGAGVANTILDMSAVPMNTATGSREQGILVKGDGVELRGFTLESPAGNGANGAAYGIKSNPNGDGTVDATNVVIADLRVRNVKMTAIDLNGASNVSVSSVMVEGVAAGFGLAVSGSSTGVTVNGLSVTNAAWGEAAVYPYGTLVPSNVRFGSNPALTAITVQPNGKDLVLGTGNAADASYNAGAEVFVPAEFNRTISFGAGAQATVLAVRQGSLAAVQAALVNASVPMQAQIVANILGPIEVLNGGVALAGRSTLDAAVAVAVDGNVINVAQGTSVVLTNPITANVTLTGSLSLTKDSGALASILTKAVVNVLVEATGMNSAQLSAVAANTLRIPAEGVTGTLAIDKDVQSLAYLLAKAAVAATVNVDATGMGSSLPLLSSAISKVDAITNLSKLTAVSGRIGNVATIASLAVSNAQSADEIGFLLSKAVGGALVRAGSSDGVMGQAKLSAVSAQIANVGLIMGLNLGAAQTATEIDRLLSKSAAQDMVVDAAGMDQGRLSAVAGQIDHVGVGAITNLVVSDAQSADELGKLLSKAANATVNASGMTSAAKLTAVSGRIGNVATIASLAVSNAQSADEIGFLL